MTDVDGVPLPRATAPRRDRASRWFAWKHHDAHRVTRQPRPSRALTGPGGATAPPRAAVGLPFKWTRVPITVKPSGVISGFPSARPDVFQESRQHRLLVHRLRPLRNRGGEG